MSRKPPRNNVTPIQGQHTFAQMQLMFNAVSQVMLARERSGLLGKQFGTKRDMYNVLGYNREPNIEDYWGIYLRQDIAKRIVKAAPNATWRRPPDIWETESPDETTPFEAAWEELIRRIPVWSYFARADRMAGIGYYGVMLLGIPGSLTAAVPPKKFRSEDSMAAIKNLLYLSAFSQRHAGVKEYEDNVKNSRFGKPKLYEIDLSGDIAGQAARETRTKSRLDKSKQELQEVDASRVIHFAEDLTEDEVHGTPRLEAVFNRLMDLEKVVGGSAEGYWRGAYGGFSLEGIPDASSAFTGNSTTDQSDIGGMVDEFAHGFRRWVALEGYKLNKIEGQDFKPKETFDTIIALISAATDIPQRILCGSERGQLASTQDEAQWNKYLEDRRNNYANPLIRDFVDRLINFGILPEPKRGYMIKWADLFSLDAKENAEVFAKMAKGIKDIAPGGQTELVISPDEIRARYLGLEPQSEPFTLPPIDDDDEPEAFAG